MFGGAEPALLAPGQLHPFHIPGASELRNSPVPLAAGGRGLFLLVLAGLVSHTKHLYFLLIKLSPGDTSVPTPLAAFIRGSTGPSSGAADRMQSTSARQGRDIKAQPAEVGCRHLHTRLPAEMQAAEM